MISVVILGNGNVATHLYNAFSKAEDITVSKINSRNLESITDSDVTIIAVSHTFIMPTILVVYDALIFHY